MRAKSVFRYAEPSVVGGFIAIDVDKEMLTEIINGYKIKIENAACDGNYELTKTLIDDYYGLLRLLEAYDWGID